MSLPQRLSEGLAFAPEYDGGLSDHRPMALLALQRLGADDKRLLAKLMTVDRPQDAASPVRETARFVVDPARPGPQRG